MSGCDRFLKWERERVSDRGKESAIVSACAVDDCEKTCDIKHCLL